MVLFRATIQGDARVIAEDPHGGWERLLPIWEAKEPSIVYFLKERVALPLFFERALIEITPRRVLYRSEGDTTAASAASTTVSVSGRGTRVSALSLRGSPQNSLRPRMRAAMCGSTPRRRACSR